ncbi:MAG: hypothetical protein IT282_16460 [Bacteroidetes bacterium]|nr:hypothetical protein [Bacteroidota bacterium]
MRFNLLLIAGMFVASAGMPGCQESGSGPGDCTGLSLPPREWLGGLSSEAVQSVLRLDGTVWSWGPGYSGTLGNGDTASSDTPVQALDLHDVLGIDQSWGAAVAVDKQGDIWFWGNVRWYAGPRDQDTNTLAPVKLAHLPGTISISMHLNVVHLLRSDCTVWRLALDFFSPKVLDGPTKVACNVVSINKLLAVTGRGRIFELVHDRFLTGELLDVVAVAGEASAHVLALRSDSTVWALDSNVVGELGDGTFVSSEVPVQVKGLTDVVQISAQFSYNLALKKDGSVWFWGFEGREGDQLVYQNTPIRIEGLDNVALICAFGECLVMKRDGTYWRFDVRTRIPTQAPL